MGHERARSLAEIARTWCREAPSSARSSGLGESGSDLAGERRESHLRVGERGGEIDAYLLQLVTRACRIEELQYRAAAEPVGIFGHLPQCGQTRRRVLLETLQRFGTRPDHTF